MATNKIFLRPHPHYHQLSTAGNLHPSLPVYLLLLLSVVHSDRDRNDQHHSDEADHELLSGVTSGHGAQQTTSSVGDAHELLSLRK